MKKSLLIGMLVLLASSCAHNKIRFTKYHSFEPKEEIGLMTTSIIAEDSIKMEAVEKNVENYMPVVIPKLEPRKYRTAQAQIKYRHISVPNYSAQNFNHRFKISSRDFRKKDVKATTSENPLAWGISFLCIGLAILFLSLLLLTKTGFFNGILLLGSGFWLFVILGILVLIVAIFIAAAIVSFITLGILRIIAAIKASKSAKKMAQI